MKVKFMPSGEEHEIEFNETVLHLANRVGLHIQSVCKGIPSCAECRVQILEGEHHVLPPSKKELDLIGTAHYVDMSRLSCQLRCFGDLVIDLKEQIEKEARATQKPRDRRARPDGQQSRAVLGGILDNVVAADAELPEELADKVEKVEVEAVNEVPHLDQKDRFYGGFLGGGERPSRSSGGRQGDRQGRRDRQRSGGQGGDRAKGQGGDRKPQQTQGQNQGERPAGSKKRKRRRRKGGGGGEAAAASASSSGGGASS